MDLIGLEIMGNFGERERVLRQRARVRVYHGLEFMGIRILIEVTSVLVSK